MGKKEKMSKQFSRNFFLNNLKEENIDSEVCRIFRFIINKDKIKKFREGLEEWME